VRKKLEEKARERKGERMVYDCLLGRSQVRGIIYEYATWEVSRGEGDSEGGHGDDDKVKG